MVWPERPRFVLFGSSIVQFSYALDGWGAYLTTLYGRQADVILRGYAGWNSRKAVEVLDQVFPKGEAVQPSLVIVYFGGNDSHERLPDDSGSHVPLDEFVENMRKIATHLKSLSKETEVIFATAPPVNRTQMLEIWGEINPDFKGRNNELLREYGDACIKLSKEMGIHYVDLFDAFMKDPNWLTFFIDGVHLAAGGSWIVFFELVKTIGRIKHLHWSALPQEFAEINSSRIYLMDPPFVSKLDPSAS